MVGEYSKVTVEPGNIYVEEMLVKKRVISHHEKSLETVASKTHWNNRMTIKVPWNNKMTIFSNNVSNDDIIYLNSTGVSWGVFEKDQIWFHRNQMKMNNVDIGTIEHLIPNNEISDIGITVAKSTTPEQPNAVQDTTPQQQSKQAKRSSDVDSFIPQNEKNQEETYVLIFANEKYDYLDKVSYATNDGEAFKECCINTLGIPEKQIFYYPNATYGKLVDGVSKLAYCMKNFEGSRAIVYYSGHGIPDEKTNEAYIIPIDGKGTNTATCYSLNTLYKTLAATKATNVTYFMDACFTGANREGSMLVAARGVAREAKKGKIEGKSVVFSASSGDETAMTYADKQHGLFTYYLLKKLQETEGDVTYEDLASYISKNVKKDAFLLNEKPQTPVVATSPAAANNWKTMKLK